MRKIDIGEVAAAATGITGRGQGTIASAGDSLTVTTPAMDVGIVAGHAATGSATSFGEIALETGCVLAAIIAPKRGASERGNGIANSEPSAVAPMRVVKSQF